MLMMSGSEYKDIPDFKVWIRSAQDKANGNSGIEKVESMTWNTGSGIQIGSGFFPTGFVTPAKYLTVRFYNLDTSGGKDVILDAVHLYNELNHLPDIPYNSIELTNV